MAGAQRNQSEEASRLAMLRGIAQRHLQEIGQQEEHDKYEEQQVQSVLAEEAQRRSTKRIVTRCLSPRNAGEDAEKGSKMRSAQDVLDRLRWDPEFDYSDYVVGYLDRFDGTMEIQVSSWLNESTAEDWIPQHRIRYFKRLVTGSDQDEIVWHRFRRIDTIFGTGGGSA